MAEERIRFADVMAMQATSFADRCTSCGACLEACPVFPMTEAAENAGPVQTIDAIIELLKNDRVADEAYDMVLSCSQACGHYCKEACPVELMPSVAFIWAVSKIRTLGKPLAPGSSAFDPEYPLNFKTVLSALQERPSGDRWITEIPPNPEPVDVVFFGGCTAHGMPHLLSECVAILEAMGIDFVALDGKDRCCGSGNIVSGNIGGVETTGAGLVSDLARFKPKEVVLYCLGCQLVVSSALAMAMEIPFKTTGIIEFLSTNLEKIPLQRIPERRIALHDSCILGTYPMFGEKARELLEAIPGVSLTELEHNRENSQCCGTIVGALRPPMGEKMRANILTEGEQAGIDVLATFCGGCHQSLAPLEDRFAFEIANYISLVAESVGARHEDMYKKYAGCGDLERILSEARSCIAASGLSVDELKRVLPVYVEPFRSR